MRSDLFKNILKMCLAIIYLIYKEDLVLNNLQWLLCHKTQPNQSEELHYQFSIFINVAYTTLDMVKIYHSSILWLHENPFLSLRLKRSSIHYIFDAINVCHEL